MSHKNDANSNYDLRVPLEESGLLSEHNSAQSVGVTDLRKFSTPLTIGVISDTHVYPRGVRRLPEEALDLFQRFAVGLIVHAGDVNHPEVLKRLAQEAPVIAVAGNNDDSELRRFLPATMTFSVGPYRFAVLHGHGNRSARVAARRLASAADCVIYGHSHIPLIEEESGTIFFNPGSATDRRWHEHFGLGVIHVDSGRITPELILFDEPRHLVNIRPSR